MEKNIKNYKEENENLRLKLELCNKELYLKKKGIIWLKSKVCRKRKSKFSIKFKPKILKPNEFKNDPKIAELYNNNNKGHLI